jgi:hypothetical protein
MNGGFLVVKGLLVRSVKDGITKNSIFPDLQSICGLYLPSCTVCIVAGLFHFPALSYLK